MYEIGVTTHFTATHRLRGPFGPATSPHGHQYRVDVAVRGPVLDKYGTLSDIAVLQRAVDDCALTLNDQDLDDLTPFQDRNSTAENVARYLFDAIGGQFDPSGLSQLIVRVWESPTAWAAFEGEVSSK